MYIPVPDTLNILLWSAAVNVVAEVIDVGATGILLPDEIAFICACMFPVIPKRLDSWDGDITSPATFKFDNKVNVPIVE